MREVVALHDGQLLALRLTLKKRSARDKPDSVQEQTHWLRGSPRARRATTRESQAKGGGGADSNRGQATSIAARADQARGDRQGAHADHGQGHKLA